jgi:hypothetical protein
MPHDGLCGVHFESGNFRLKGRLWLARGDDPKATVLLLHGMPGIELNLDIAIALREEGWNTLVFHYRGSWGSEGIYRMATLPEDVRAALDYLGSREHPQVDPQRLILIGHSMGGWAALMAGGTDPRVRAVAFIAAVCDPQTFHLSVDDVEKGVTPYLADCPADTFFAEIKAPGIRCAPMELLKGFSGRPIFVVHGRKDEIIPCSESEWLYEAAPHPKRIAIHDEANHCFAWHREWLKSTLLSWLTDVERGLWGNKA